MKSNDEILKRTYENLKSALRILEFENFDNNYVVKKKIERQIKEKISESLKTCIADLFDTSNLIVEIYNAEINEDETAIEYCLEELEAS